MRLFQFIHDMKTEDETNDILQINKELVLHQLEVLNL